MKTKCFSVKLEALRSISDKCFQANAFNGSTALIPKSQVFGVDYNSTKSDAYWISEWILSKKDIQYSTKKERYFDSNTRKMLPNIKIEHHIPKKKTDKISHESSLFK